MFLIMVAIGVALWVKAGPEDEGVRSGADEQQTANGTPDRWKRVVHPVCRGRQGVCAGGGYPAAVPHGVLRVAETVTS